MTKDIILELIRKLETEENKVLDNFIKERLNFVKPKIKGEITKNKLKWRGVKLYQQKIKNHDFTQETIYWLQQRDKRLGDPIKLITKFKND